MGGRKKGYDDSAWKDAAPKLVFDISKSDAPGCLVDRTIPAQRHAYRRFEKAVCFRDPDASEPLLAAWNRLLTENTPITIPAHTTRTVEISAGVEECGYLLYAFEGGKEAKVETLCSEAYAYPPAEKQDSTAPAQPVKGDRTDYVNGRLYGSTSSYQVSGNGTEDQPETYEPYWFRTFRYIRLTITTKEEALTLRQFSYRETGYPLDVKTTFEASDESFVPIWDISVRTLHA